jgi:GNAT superfamily N-acetyltransferase
MALLESVQVEDATRGDIPEILALQKLAYRSEAEIHDDFTIPPLHQTLSEIEADFRRLRFLKAVEEGRIIGSVRAHQERGTCYVGRLIVLPGRQNQGLGTLLMQAIEDRFPRAARFELFTGHLSARNLYFYDKLGYREFRRAPATDKVMLIFLEKPGPAGNAGQIAGEGIEWPGRQVPGTGPAA